MKMNDKLKMTFGERFNNKFGITIKWTSGVTPTVTDTLEYLENVLENDPEEFACCKNDTRLRKFKWLKDLLK